MTKHLPMTLAAAILAATPPAAAQEMMRRPAFSLDELIAAQTPAPPPPYVEVDAGRAPQVAVTGHRLRQNGRDIRYKATVGETFIPGAANREAEAALVTIAYTRDVADASRRPVLFIFNGGPGASSTPLQGAMAPRIFDKTREAYVDNVASPIDAADLVFFDPVGSGFSRPLPGKAIEQYWSTRGDAQSVRYLIRDWLKKNGREASPRYIVGESYGTSRAGHVADIGADLNLDGIILVSSTGMPAGPDLPFVMRFPTFAASAAYHGKGRFAGQDPERVFEENARFAEGPYLAALVQGNRLPEAARDAMAEEVAARLGLTKSVVLDQNLRLSNYPFMLGLLKAEGLRIGQLDARAKGALETYAGRQPPYDDPSMGLSKAPDGTPPNSRDHVASNDRHKAFLADELGFRTDEGYQALNLKMLFAFRHQVDLSYRPTDSIAALMRKQPGLRLLLTGGIFDITTPLQSAIYNLAHADIPMDRVSVERFAAGHEVYDGSNLLRFNEAVRRFVTRP